MMSMYDDLHEKITNSTVVPKEFLMKNIKRSEKTMSNGLSAERKEIWSMYDVIVIDKDSLKIVIDEHVIAKNREHAKGKAGVFDVLEDKDFDDTKFTIVVVHFTDIRPVKENE